MRKNARSVLVVSFLLPGFGLAGCATTGQTKVTQASPDAAPAAPAAPPPVAMVDGKPITEEALAQHQSASGLERAAALEDLIDLTLVRAHAAAHNVSLPDGPLDASQRAAAELQLARAIPIDLPRSEEQLVVDQVLVKDAADAKKRAAQKKLIEKLRALVVTGTAFADALKKIKPAPSDTWEVKDRLALAYSAVPAAAHDLAPGTVSPVIAEGGALQLFRIVERKPTDPAPEAVHRALMERLRRDAKVEMGPATAESP